ncbi:MAG: hypothetical protein KA149_03105 [Chitinophagales bacterium]|nr:hypothetical protein [Chitinophagales bacterium]
MKTIITSVLLASALFCIAAPENNGKETKATGKITTTKVTAGKDKTTDSAVSTTKVTKTKKVKKDTYVAPWINNNGGGNTSYH